jgi:hypothetical protein
MEAVAWLLVLNMLSFSFLKCAAWFDPRLVPNFIQVPQWFGVTHQGQEGEFSAGGICWVAIDGLVFEMAKGPKDGLENA